MTPQDLKNSILQLAIQGKLVPQIESEGNAEDLYREIQKEKQKLIAEKKIKKEKPLEPIKEEDIPFDIPQNWKWCRVFDISFLSSGNVYEECLEGYLYLKVADMNIEENKIEIVSSSRRAFSSSKDLIWKNSIIFPKRGGAISTNKKKLVMKEPILIDSNTMGMTPFITELLPYVYYWFMSVDLGKISTGTSVPQINNKDIYPLFIPLPPLEEQKRIVAKIEELLPLVEKYGKAYERLEEFNKKFPGDMKKSILQMAIQGKLVEQRPEEGTAEELYELIQTEKARLIKEGKIKKEKPLEPIKEEDIPFDIPQSWKWVRLGDLLDIARGGSPRPIKDFITTAENGINWIKIGDTEKGGKYINSTAEKIRPEGLKKSRYVEKGDFLLSNSMSFGRPYILNVDGAIHDGWLVLKQIANAFDKDYLYYLLSSPMVFYQFCDRVAGAVVNNLNSDKVALTVIPLPPLEEQKRIVAKIEEVLPLCDALIK